LALDENVLPFVVNLFSAYFCTDMFFFFDDYLFIAREILAELVTAD